MKKICLSLLIFFGATLLSTRGALFEPQFLIKYPPELSHLATFTSNQIQKQIGGLVAFFGPPVQDTLHFVLTATEREFKNETGNALPYWVAAVTIFPEAKVVLKDPRLGKTTLKEYQNTLSHELVHLIQGCRIPLNLSPSWFNEGLAIYLSEKISLRQSILLSRATIRDQLIPLQKINALFRYSQPTAELAYAESVSVIEYLIQVYGPTIIQEILNRMQTGQDFALALSATTNIEADDFPYYWKQYIKRAYHWLFLLDIQYIIWLVLPVLVILAFIRVKFKNRKIEAEWNLDEDIQTDESHDPGDNAIHI